MGDPRFQEGIDIHVVSDRLAHSSTHITSEIYTHVTRPMQSDAAERVAARILARDPARKTVIEGNGHTSHR
jgi:integrase